MKYGKIHALLAMAAMFEASTAMQNNRRQFEPTKEIPPVKPIKGIQWWEYDTVTGDLKRVSGDLGVFGCKYFQALNEKNAKKKISKLNLK